MKDVLNKIAKIISPRNPIKEWQGGYLHTDKGEVVMTDGKRMLLISDCGKRDNDCYIDNKGSENGTFGYPNYQKYSDDGYYMWAKKYELDFANLVLEKGWMKKSKEKVIFSTKAFRVVGKSEAMKVDVHLGMYNTSYLADFLRVIRAYYNNRTKSVKVTMFFNPQMKMPLHILTEDKKFHYIVMPIQFYNEMYIDKNTIDEVELEEKKTVF